MFEFGVELIGMVAVNYSGVYLVIAVFQRVDCVARIPS